MAIKHSRQGIALGAVAALGVTMLGASPAFAAGDSNNVDLIIKGAGNGVINGLIGDGVQLILEWEGDVDTQKFDTLTWKVLSAVDENGEDTLNDGAYSWSYYDEYEDEVEYESYYYEDMWGGDFDYWAPFALEGTDEDATGNGYVGPYQYDATSAEWAFNNYEWYNNVDEDYVTNPWYFVDGNDEDGYYFGGEKKNTIRVQAFIDDNLNGVADGNELRSQVATVNLYNPEMLTGTVSQKDVPGWFYPEITGNVTLDQKLSDYNPRDDWFNNGYETTGETLAEDANYYLALQQPVADGNDSGNYDYFDLDQSDWEDGYGWTVHEDGTVTYEDTFSYYNEGDKVNKIWLWNEDAYDDSGASAARVSNIDTFSYVAASKIVKRSDTTAKMYAFDILGAGLVQFLHNGKVVASIDMVDEADPRALADGNRPYFVRTVNFVRGKNTLEVVVNGKSLKKHTYTLRSGMA